MFEKEIDIRLAEITDYPWLEKHDDDIDSIIIKKKIVEKEIFLVLKNNEIIGWLRYNYFWDDIPFITHLWLLDGYRKMGIGTKLLNYWEEIMKTNGHKVVLTSTQKTREFAQQFYKKRGYTEIGGFHFLDEPYEILYLKKIIE